MAHSQKDRDVCEQHPFGVEASSEKGRQKSTAYPRGRNYLGDGSSTVMKTFRRNRLHCWKSYGKDICFSVLFIIVAVAIVGLAAYTIKKGQKMDLLDAQVNDMAKQTNNDTFKSECSKMGDVLEMLRNRMAALENQSVTQGFEVDVLVNTLPEIGYKVEQFKTQLDALRNQTEAHISEIDVSETSLSVKGCTASVNSTMDSIVTTTQENSKRTNFTASTIASPTVAPNAFQVLNASETVYKNYNFLALQVRVPYDGQSISENWCRDYENLCKQFGRRPTGCGANFSNADKYKEFLIGCRLITLLQIFLNNRNCFYPVTWQAEEYKNIFIAGGDPWLPKQYGCLCLQCS